MESEEDTQLGCLLQGICWAVIVGGVIIYGTYNSFINKRQQIISPIGKGYHTTEIIPKDSMKNYNIPLKINKIEFKDVNQNGKLETLVITFDEQ